jgi:hypothetical protein
LLPFFRCAEFQFADFIDAGFGDFAAIEISGVGQIQRETLADVGWLPADIHSAAS